jgi:hypothetical protein
MSTVKFKPDSEAPIAYLWRRENEAGGYVQRVSMDFEEALGWALDGENVRRPDKVIPLYAKKEWQN